MTERARVSQPSVAILIRRTMRVTDGSETRIVTADGVTLDVRTLDPDRPCDLCGDVLLYDDGADAVFCATCDEWRENACRDPQCDYCTSRPARPLTRRAP